MFLVYPDGGNNVKESAHWFLDLGTVVCVPRGRKETAVFDIKWATKATVGLKPQIENFGLVGCELSLVCPGGVWFCSGHAQAFKSKTSLC